MLDRDYILCLRTFLAISYSEFDFLTVGESLETIAFDGAEMDENIRTIFTLNKAETFAFVEPFDCAGCCRHTFYLYCLRRRVQAPFHLLIIYG